ncbi:MAG TPA: hypothetical protein VIJ51_00940 [Solirubrobacteraceae bacterium]
MGKRDAAGRVVIQRSRARRAQQAALAIACIALACVLPASAVASVSQSSIFQDDDLLIYNTTAGTQQTMQTLALLGVQSIRVSVYWRVVAPDPLSTTRPANFDASDPAAYPADAWSRYDQVVEDAHALGIAVNLDITSPAPLWATQTPDRADIANTYDPSGPEFGAFVHAVSERYSGTYVPPPPASSTPTPAPTPCVGLLGCLFNPNGTGSSPAPPPPPIVTTTPLPRVSSWSIWNEPNQPGWLTPQWAPDAAGHLVERSPALYRSLVNAGYASLLQTGHGSDTILIGETAPKGLSVRGETRAISPLLFIRDLYCVNSKLQPLAGSRASALACPVTAAQSAAFPAQNPGLFKETGWAHHPYELTFAPTVSTKNSDFVTIANLSRLGTTFDGIERAYHRSRQIPYYLTEFGYMSDPPSPVGVSLSQQSAFLNQAEFIAYSNPRVRDLSQFLLQDSPPIACTRCSDPGGYGSSFETGLEFQGGKPKPSFAAYRMPIFLPSPTVKKGAKLRVWGLVRPAPHGAAVSVAIQFRPGTTGAFKRIATARTKSHPAYLDTHVSLTRSGQLRLAWRDPTTHAVIYSRDVSATVR